MTPWLRCPSVPKTTVNHVGHRVADLDRARHFYVEAFGFEVVRELHPPDQGTDRLLGLTPPLGMTACYLKRDGFVLELLHFAAAEPVEAPDRTMAQVGLTHLSFGVDDLDEACAAVEAAGGEVLPDTNLGMAVFVKDPDGQLLELLTGWDPP